MSTSSLPASTSTTPSKNLRSTKRFARQPLSRALRNTETSAPDEHFFFGSAQTSNSSSKPVTRHRWLIQKHETGDFLGTIQDGNPIWVQHPLEALSHTSMETASSNLHKLRDYYKIDGIRLEPVNFYAYPERPTQWFTDYD